MNTPWRRSFSSRDCSFCHHHAKGPSCLHVSLKLIRSEVKPSTSPLNIFNFLVNFLRVRSIINSTTSTLASEIRSKRWHWMGRSCKQNKSSNVIISTQLVGGSYQPLRATSLKMQTRSHDQFCCGLWWQGLSLYCL